MRPGYAMSDRRFFLCLLKILAEGRQVSLKFYGDSFATFWGISRLIKQRNELLMYKYERISFGNYCDSVTLYVV